MTTASCPFCFPDAALVFHAGELVLGLWDKFPASPGHALLIPRRHVMSWLEATAAERAELTEAIEVARAAILGRHQPEGFNVGLNLGEAAGQTVAHLHLHVIPRYRGDVPDPRGGIRGVIPGKARYSTEEDDAFIARDAEERWVGREHVPSDSSTGAVSGVLQVMPPRVAADAAAFGERILQLLDEGRFTATYKYAVLLALTDLCLEHFGAGGPQTFSTRQLAEKIVELYWPHTAPYPGNKGPQVLAQNRGGQAEIVSAIQKFRDRFAGDPSEPLIRASARARGRYERLVQFVEWKLIEMPLPRLQVIGESESPFLYRLSWDTSVKRRDVEGGGFDNRIFLTEGAAEHLVQLSGLLRPLIQRAWAGMIAAMNRDATDEARLQEFLFGAQRIALDPVRQDLRDLQDNRCFYCEARIAGAVEVDHFIPWARHPDNGIENLVVADQRCNGSKRDFLAAGAHVEHWTQRFAACGAELAEVARRASWERHPERILNVARTIYTRLPDDVRLWSGTGKFATVAAERAQLLAALGRTSLMQPSL